MRTRPYRHLLKLAVAALLLSSCGGDDQRSGADVTTAPTVASTTEAKDATTSVAGAPTTTGATTDNFTITAKNVAFSPQKLTIAVDEEVEILLNNVDAGVPHNIHFFTPTEVKTDVKNGKARGEKDRFQLKVDKAGTYKFTCDVHPTDAMTGELVVT